MTKDQSHLICFDMDGVLISSMVIANQIFYDVMHRELGLPLYDYPQQKRPMSLSAEERVATLWTDDVKRLAISQDEIQRALQKYRDEKMAVDIPLLPRAKEAVESMAAHFEHLACVSSNPDYIIDETLKRLGIRQHFDRITGLDHITNAKPDPEIYLATAAAFGIRPELGLVLEDSTNGIISAKAAGMRVIGVATGLESVEDLQKTHAELVLRDLSDLTFSAVNKILYP